MDRVFCYHCGYNTLIKVAVEINEDGEIIELQDPKRKISTRGTIVIQFFLSKCKFPFSNDDLISIQFLDQKEAKIRMT